MSECPVCKAELRKVERDSGDRVFFDCPACGPYSVSGSVAAFLEGRLDQVDNGRSIVSQALYKMTKGKSNWPMITGPLLDDILKSGAVPSHAEQLDNLLIWLAEETKEYGKYMAALPGSYLSAVGATGRTAFLFLVAAARERHFIESTTQDSYTFITLANGWGIHPSIRLTFSGWSHVEELRRGHSSSRIAFMAMKFGDAQTDLLFRDHFKNAVSETGFELRRLDEQPQAGLIDDRLRVEIRQSRFLIADLTHHNNGAYWEAGFAEGLGKPVIYTCRKDVFDDKTQGTHFDTNHHLTVVWEPDKLEDAMERLKATIRATLPEDAKLSD